MLRKNEDPQYLIYLLIYSNELAYLHLITALVYGNIPRECHKQGLLKLLAKTLKNMCK